MSSAWIDCIPGGVFCVELLRPSVLVELGTHSGVSYCSLCQVIKELRIKCRCTAVDTWMGDEFTGNYGTDTLVELKKYHDARYQDFSSLWQTTFDAAAGRVEDHSIDLLHIDGNHTFEMVSHDFENWLPKMSSRGTILFHDILVTQPGFGVNRFWNETKEKYPHLEFPTRYGLGVIVTGNENTRLKRWIERTPDETKQKFLRLLCERGADMWRQLEQQSSQGNPG